MCNVNLQDYNVIDVLPTKMTEKTLKTIKNLDKLDVTKFAEKFRMTQQKEKIEFENSYEIITQLEAKKQDLTENV